jgi:transcriptional regulator of acetoin/glycerol metabolism
LDKPARDRLLHYDWPGNVRELRNVIVAAHAQSDGGPIEVADFLHARRAPLASPRNGSSKPFQELRREIVEAFERHYFAELHLETGGNVSEMSRRSGIERSTVRQYLARCGLRGSE